MQSIFENDLIYKIPLSDFSNKESLLQSSFVSGNMEASMVIFFKDKNNNLDESKFTFLSKMLSAVNVNIEDVLLVNNNVNLSLINLNKIINASIIFLFDINPKDVGVQKQLDLYNINTYNKVKYVFCEDLHSIEQSVNSKKAIWSVLKEIYKL